MKYIYSFNENISTETKSKIDMVLKLLNEIQVLNKSDNIRQAIQLIMRENNISTNNSIGDSNALYFESKSNNILIGKLPNSANAKFKVFDINGNDGKFIYIGPAINENWFETVCNITNLASEELGRKTKIITTQAGIVRNENDNWVVIKRANIKFE